MKSSISMEDIKRILQPQSVAIIGASENPTKLGSIILNNLIRGGFKGKIYPVNPNYPTISGMKAYKKVSDINGSVEVVCIVIPAEYVLDAVKDCAKKKVKGLVIISAGFREIGPEGDLLEKQIKIIAYKNKMRILGPNCLGYISRLNNTNVSFAAANPLKGNIAFMSQSGAFCTALLDMSIPKNLGFSHFISLGNKADINELNLMEHFLEDDSVKVISAYLEDIYDGSELVKTYQLSKNPKPFIILKAGQTEASKAAIASHTGSIAGSIQTFKTGITQAGIIEAENTRELFNLMMIFSWSKKLNGKRIAIITNAGGPGIIATDTITQSGLEMAQISENSKSLMRKALPAESSVKNPVDVIGDALADRFKIPLEILATDENVDAIVVLLTPQLITQIEDTAKLIISASQLYQKPIIPIFIGEKYVSPALQRFYDNKIPAFTEITDAIYCLKHLYDFTQYKESKKIKVIEKTWQTLEYESTGKYSKEINRLIKDKVKVLPDTLIVKLAEEVNLQLPRQLLTNKLSDLLTFSDGKYPVVLKVANEIVSHKTEIKGIYLNIDDPNELISAYQNLSSDIEKQFKVKNPNMIIQEQLKGKAEFFIGANRDGNSKIYTKEEKGFGHLLVFGHGGIYTEIYKDFGYVLTPANRIEIEKALKTTKIYQIISGARGQACLNIDKLIRQIEAVQKLTILYPQIISLDINPLMLTEKDAVAVDVKIYLGS